MDDSSKVRYDMILGKYLLTYLGFNLKISDHVIEVDDGPFKGPLSLMVNMGTCEFKDLNTAKIPPEELFTNFYTEEIHES